MHPRHAVLSTATILLSSLACHAATVTLSSAGPTAYSENFDSLAPSGTNPLSGILPGWSFSNNGASITTYLASSGGDLTQTFYSYGAPGSSDRAFGSIAGDSAPGYLYGFSVTVGDDSTTLESLTLAYRGELWKTGNNTNVQTHYFHYSLNATSLSSGTWLSVPSLRLSSVTGRPINSAVDGNLYFNEYSHTFAGLNLPAGSTIFFRWQDFNDVGTDHGMAIDDLVVTATFETQAVPSVDPVAVPVPSAALGGMALLGGLAARARRR